jgi:hypothetical protein
VIIEVVAREVGKDGHIETTPAARPWSRAWLETSVTSSVAPRHALGHQFKEVARFGRGVHEGRTSPATWYSMVPTSTVLRAAALSSASSRKAVVVLPLVPVMPVAASLRSGWPKKAAEACGQRAAAVLDLQHRQARLKDQQMVKLAGAESVMMPSAPAAMAFVDVAVAVGRAALHGHKNRARPHLARVVFDARHRLVRAAAHAHCRYFFNQFFPVHLGFHCRLPCVLSLLQNFIETAKSVRARLQSVP